jgi:hypothetical protein
MASKLRRKAGSRQWSTALAYGVPFVLVVVGGSLYLGNILGTQFELKDKVNPQS